MTSGHLPGQRIGNTYTPRQVLMSTKNVGYAIGPLVMNAANAYDGANTDREDEIREGTILAQITSGTGAKQWLPCKRTTTTVGGSGSSSAQGPSAVIPVVDARAFKAADVITVGNNTSCTISSINYSTNMITLSASISYDPGEAVTCTSVVGSEIPRAILGEFVKLKDDDATWRNKGFGQAIIHGYVNEDQVLGDLAACKAATNYFDGILFADEQQGN
jgi:hypothetical protein